MRTVMVYAGLLVVGSWGCNPSSQTAAADAAASPAPPQAAASGATARLPSPSHVVSPAAPATLGTGFSVKAAGSFRGIKWKPVTATLTINGAQARLAIHDVEPDAKCRIGTGDEDLRLEVTAPYQVGVSTDVAKLLQPDPKAKEFAKQIGDVYLMRVSQVEVAAKYTGSVRFLSTPRKVGEAARVAVDLRADGTSTVGELDARICVVE